MQPLTLDKQTNFRKELESLLNCNSLENTSDTPDYILAEYLTNCLASFDLAVKAREIHYGREKLEVATKVYSNTRLNSYTEHVALIREVVAECKAQAILVSVLPIGAKPKWIVDEIPCEIKPVSFKLKFDTSESKTHSQCATQIREAWALFLLENRNKGLSSTVDLLGTTENSMYLTSCDPTIIKKPEMDCILYGEMISVLIVKSNRIVKAAHNI